MRATLTCFLAEGFDIDVDNVAKPILDAIKANVLLSDDALVVDLTIRKRNLGVALSVVDPPPGLAAALETGDPFVYVEVEEEPSSHVLRYGNP